MSGASLELLLSCAYGTGVVPPQLNPADAELIEHKFAEAAQLYATQSETPSIHAKRGFCLAMLGEDEEAETLLTVDNVGGIHWHARYLHGRLPAVMDSASGEGSAQRSRWTSARGDVPRLKTCCRAQPPTITRRRWCSPG